MSVEGVEVTIEGPGEESNAVVQSTPSGGAVSDSAASEPDNPPEVQRRIKALKRIQLEVAQTESEFFKEMHQLEMKYSEKYSKFYEKRESIILGKYEPKDEECIFGDDDAKKDADNNNAGAQLAESLSQLKIEEKKEFIKGIPDFWLTICQNVDMLSDMIQEHDEPILKHLQDVKVEMTNEPMGFKLFFHFSPNEYFKNSVLTKTYEMKCEVDKEDPFSFEGPEIIKCIGSPIDWYEGKNVTVRVVRKKQKHKQTGNIRMVAKNIEVPSFFEFFTPPEAKEGDEIDDEVQLRLTTDFEVGQYIRERIVPRAVLYFTGEALDDDDDDEEEEYDEEETEGEEEEEESQQSEANDA